MLQFLKSIFQKINLIPKKILPISLKLEKGFKLTLTLGGAPTSSNELNEYDQADIAEADQIIFSDANDGNLIKRDSAGNLASSKDGVYIFADGSTQTVGATKEAFRWSLSTVVDNNQNSDFTDVQDIFIKPDGTKIFFSGATPASDIESYTLTTSWDIRTNDTLTSQTLTNPFRCFTFKVEGSFLYVLESASNTVRQIALDTNWDITSGSTETTGSITVSGTAVSMAFKPDGLTLYVLSSDGILESYTLSTAWDITTITATPTTSFDLTSIVSATVFNGIFFKPDGEELYFSDDTNDQIVRVLLSTPWDIVTITKLDEYIFQTSVDPFAVFLKPNGGRMFVVDSTNDEVNQYDLGLKTNGKIITEELDANYLNVNFAQTSLDGSTQARGATPNETIGFLDTAIQVSADDFNYKAATSGDDPTGIYFKIDGFHMYVIDSVERKLYDFTLGTAWDVSTQTGTIFTFEFSLTSDINSICFRDDGLVLYVSTDSGSVFSFSLSEAWNILTLSEMDEFTSIFGAATGVCFSADGSKMYVSHPTSNVIIQTEFSTRWDISSSVVNGIETLNVTSLDTTFREIAFKSDGKILYFVGQENNLVYQIDIPIPWNLLSATDTAVATTSIPDGTPSGLFIKPSMSQMFVSGTTNDMVYPYDLGINIEGKVITPEVITNNSTVSYAQTFADESTQSRAATPNGTSGFLETAVFEKLENLEQGSNTSTGIHSVEISIDGLSLFVLGNNSGTQDRTLFQYDMESQWEIDSANPSPIALLDLSSFSNSPQDFYFRDTGLTLFVVFFGGQLREFSLTTPFDLSTATITVINSFTSGNGSTRGVDFSPDGNRFYMYSESVDLLTEYTMSTTWDISTAVAGNTLVLTGIDTVPERIKFREDGTALYFIGTNNNEIYKIILTTPWNITTPNLGVGVADETLDPDIGDLTGLWINPDMTKMFVGGPLNDLYQYALGISVSGIIQGIPSNPYRTSALSSETFGDTDGILGLSDTTGPTVSILTSVINSGKTEITIKDEGGNATTNAIIITPESGTIDGAATGQINSNFGSVTYYTTGSNLFSR